MIEENFKPMIIEEKIGQLFINMGSSTEKEYLKNVLNQYKFGVVRYNQGSAKRVLNQK